jgi:hypothetical protein
MRSIRTTRIVPGEVHSTYPFRASGNGKRPQAIRRSHEYGIAGAAAKKSFFRIKRSRRLSSRLPAAVTLSIQDRPESLAAESKK